MLRNMFTVATNYEGEATGKCNLLFHKKDEKFTDKEILDITTDPLCRELMGSFALFTRLPCTKGEELLLSPDLDVHAIDKMPRASSDDVVKLITPETGLTSFNLQEVYYNCPLPHRTIVGCTECLNLKTAGECELKRLWGRIGEEGITTDAEDATSQLKSRRSVIAGFTYVSPTLTRDRDFITPYRPHDDHNFNCIDENSEIVRKGLRERGRARKFRKTACSQCLVINSCAGHRYNSYDTKYCRGPYVETEKEAVQKILKDAKIPFTERQLLFLARNSGQLDKRYNRRIYWATFQYDPFRGGLVFGLSRYSGWGFITFQSYKEAEACIRAHNTTVYEVKPREKLEAKSKALLVELGQWSYSPTHRSGWHATCYQALGLEFNRWNNSWDLRFRYNNSGGGYRPNGMLLPWGVEANSLEDVYKAYGMLKTIEKQSHEDNYHNTHK